MSQAASILVQLSATAPANFDTPAGDWPNQSLLDSLVASNDLTNASAETIARLLLTTSMRRRENGRIEALESILRSRLPQGMLDQLDFTIATHLVNHDEYLRWVIQMIGGWLNIGDGNCHCFNHAIRHMPEGGAVIEIGSFLGVSVSVLSYYLTRLGRSNRLYNADPWHFEGTEKPVGGFFDGARPVYRDYCVETYKKNVSLFCEQNMPVSIEAFSDDFFKMWDDHATVTDVFGNKVKLGGPISFAYIDGNHTYEAAKKDFENVARHLLPGGFVLFDDSNPVLNFGCVQTAREAAQTPGFRHLFQHVNGLNVLLKKS